VVTKEQILAALPNLNKAELRAVHATAGHLLGATGGADASIAAPGSVGAIIFEALSGALCASMPYASLPTATARQFEGRVPGFVAFLDANFAGWNKNKVGQLAFLRMMFHLIKDDLNERKVKPTIGVVIVHMSRMYEVFENAFPNYLSNGLGPMILKNFKSAV
jgi:hypothetical protein